jgi:hypothetical protein
LDFINLDDVIDTVVSGDPASEPSLPGPEDAELAHIERISRAAAALHRALSNFRGESPRWAEVSVETGEPLFWDVRVEGLHLLESVSGWARRRRAEIARYLHECQLLGVKPNADPFHVPHFEDDQAATRMGHHIGVKPTNGKYGAARFRRPWTVGFERSELIRFLDECGLAHGLTTNSDSNARGGKQESDGRRESPSQRQQRRRNRFVALGGEMRRAGTGWHCVGVRGALAALAREEADAGRPMSHKKDVRNDLIVAMEGSRRG